jgi:hypothetical protein
MAHTETAISLDNARSTIKQFRLGLVKRFLLGAAISVGTTSGLVGLACLCICAWVAETLGTMNALAFFTAVLLPPVLRLLLGGIVISIILAADLPRYAHKAAAVVVGLFVASIISCLLVGITVLWFEWEPVPSPRSYAGVEAQFGFEEITSWGRCASYSYEVALSRPLIQEYYEERMHRYCTGTWGFAATPQSNYTCYEATCDILQAENEQYFTVHICPVDSASTEVVQKDCMKR